MIYRNLNGSNYKLKCEKRGNIIDTLPLFMRVMKTQVLKGHGIVRHVSMIVLTNYMVYASVYLCIYKLIGRKVIRIVDFYSFRQTYISITHHDMIQSALR